MVIFGQSILLTLILITNQANPSGINKTQQFSVAWLDEYKRRHETGDFGTVISDGSIGTKGRYVYYPEGTDYYDLMYKKKCLCAESKSFHLGFRREV